VSTKQYKLDRISTRTDWLESTNRTLKQVKQVPFIASSVSTLAYTLASPTHIGQELYTKIKDANRNPEKEKHPGPDSHRFPKSRFCPVHHKSLDLAKHTTGVHRISTRQRCTSARPVGIRPGGPSQPCPSVRYWWSWVSLLFLACLVPVDPSARAKRYPGGAEAISSSHARSGAELV